MKHISHEVAEASRAAAAKFTSAKYTDVLVQTAKQLERLQARRRRLRKDLKQVEESIRCAKRELRMLAQQIGKGKDE